MVIFFEFIYKKYIINIMVVKKKRTYKKQKGGITAIDRIMIPFFNIINKLIRICFIVINTVVITNANGNKLNKINRIIEELNKFINIHIKYSLFIDIITNINSCIKEYIQKILDIKEFIKKILEIIIESLLSDFSQNLKFIDKFLKIYIHYLFIEYLFAEDNEIFKSLFMQLLKSRIFSKYYFIIKENKQDNLNELERRLRDLFLNDYSKEYRGIPVFYGGLLFDSQYNEFVCRQVGASSNKKRNFIINPVLAFAYSLFYKLITKNTEIKQLLDNIDKLPKINQTMEQLTKKINEYEKFNGLIVNIFQKIYLYIFSLIAFVIQYFNTTSENSQNYLRRLIFSHQLTKEQKVRTNYDYLYSKIHVPKLTHVKADSKFCIVLNQNGAEEVVQPSTFSKCALHYGCNLKMTPIIREENISSMNDILRLAQILLLIVLTYGDNIFMDVTIQTDFAVDRYNKLFTNKLEGRQINNRNMNSIGLKLDQFQIKTLVKKLSIKYKDLLIEKIINNTPEIDRKLEMIRDELRKHNSLKNLYDYLVKEKDNICKNNISNRVNAIKQHIYGSELQKIFM